MAVTQTIPAGLINKSVIFKQPTSSLNDEGGQEVSYSTGFETRAYVTRFNQFRGTEANVTALIGALDFNIRYREAAEEVNKDWLIEYKGFDYVIHEIEPLDQENRFIRFTAKSKGTAVLSGYSAGGEGGTGGGADNFTDFTFDDASGLMTFTGADPGDTLTVAEFFDINNPYFAYENAEGHPYSVGPFYGDSITAAGFTPGDVGIRWRRLGPAPSFTPLTPWAERTLTVTSLAVRRLRLWRTGAFDLNPGVWTVHVYNIADVDLGTATDIEGIIALWNADPTNAAFGQITDYVLPQGYYEMIVTPNPGQTAYPMSYIKYSF